MRVCNACRYCEGFCAVFPAMELRRTFTETDLTYLAHLCHNCRDCYYACQYAPPHEFALNVPRTMAELRLATYRQWTWPRGLARLFDRSAATLTVSAAAAVLLFLALALLGGRDGVVAAQHGAGSFYRVITYALMVVPFGLLGAGALALLVAGAWRFGRRHGPAPAGLSVWRAHGRALRDTLQLRYLAGGGHGCNYPDERFSMARRWCHHLVFYGFGACFAATVLAFAYEHLLHRTPPYPLLSWPVIAGTLGGLALLAGTAGLLYLKARMDPEPAAGAARGLDTGFLVLLLATSLSGLVLLALRETAAMGSLLVVHLGIVAALFVTMPYGKFVHAVYRYAALVQNAREQSGD